MKVEIIEEKRNGRLLVKVDNVKYNLPKGLAAKLINDSLPVDVRVMRFWGGQEKLTDRLIKLSDLAIILKGLNKWDKQIEDRFEEYKETGL